MKNIISDKRNVLIIILAVILSVFSAVVIQFDNFKYYLIKDVNIYLIILLFIFIVYIFSHFVFKIKDLYDFIYKKRYFISILIFLILVFGKFNGSSLGCWNNFVQPNDDYSDSTIIGEPLKIRSDEFLVNLPYTFSQFYNNFNYRNDNIMSENVDMFTSTTAPVKDVLILTKPFTIGYILFGKDYGLSIYWYGRLIALFLISFEFCMLITKNNKLVSFLGMFLIAGSPAVMYWYSNYLVDLLIYGQLCIILFNLFLKEYKTIKKIIYSIFLGFSFSSFIFVLYPAWQIPLGYMYLAFATYIFLCNYKQNKRIFDYKFLLISLLIIVFFISRFLYLSSDTIKLIMSTSYPGNRISIGGGMFYYNFNYILSPLFSFLNMNNPCEVSSFISLFPLPMIISFIYLLKNKNKIIKTDNIIILFLLILSIIFTVYTIFKLPNFICKITLLSMTTSIRIVPILALINVFILLLLLSKNNSNKKEIKINKKIISVALVMVITFIELYFSKKGIKEINPDVDISKLNSIIILLLFSSLNFSILYMKNIKYKISFSIVCIMLSCINIFGINPVNIGTSQIYEKEFAKVIQDITEKDSKGKWMVLDSIVFQNYLIMNGANVINSTNIYPNLELWKKLDPEKKFYDIYNRYSHVNVKLTEEKTSFELISQDTIKLNLDFKDIDIMCVKYFLSNKILDIPKKYEEHFKLIYNKDNMYIYSYKK